jgi:hypothetical protein
MNPTIGRQRASRINNFFRFRRISLAFSISQRAWASAANFSMWNNCFPFPIAAHTSIPSVSVP